jgi:hypothetical protein
MQYRTFQQMSLIVSFLFLSGNNYPAWADSDNATDASLAKLENRFFEHPYNKDTEADRLSRIEAFVFGTAQTGSVDERLKHIIASIPAEPESQATPSTNAGLPAGNQPAGSGAMTSSEPGTLPDGSTYPRVTNLEQELLGSTFANEALSKRLARLETKAFGAPSSSTDMALRVDQLDQYAQRHDLYGERGVAQVPYGGQYNAIRSYAPQTSLGQSQFVGSISERLAMMEAQEFGKTYPDHSLAKRVKKLDEKVFSQDKDRKVIADKPLPDQVDALWLTLHPNGNNATTPSLGHSAAANDSYSYDNGSSQYPGQYPSGNNGSSTSASNNPSHHGWLHALAKTAGTVGKIAATSMSSYGGYPGYGFGGGGMGGFGGYGGGYGGYPSYGGYGSSYGTGNYFGTPGNYGNTLPNSY